MLFFSGYDISVDKVSVTVDFFEIPFKLVPVGAPSELGFSAKVEPEPPVGHSVTLEGDFCIQPNQCETKSITYMVGEPDVTPPAETMPVSFDVYDYTDYESSGGDCTSDSDLAYWVELKAPVPDPAGSPVIYTLEAYRSDDLQKLVFTGRTFYRPQGTRASSSASRPRSSSGKSPPEAFCFRVKTTDAASNPAPETSESPIVICKPCFYRVSDAPNAGFGPPPQPMWDSSDIYPSGPCDPSISSGAGGNYPDAGVPPGDGGGETSSSSGGQDQVIGGCGCRAAGEESGSTASLARLTLLAGLVMRVGRRRRARC